MLERSSMGMVMVSDPTFLVNIDVRTSGLPPLIDLVDAVELLPPIWIVDRPLVIEALRLAEEVRGKACGELPSPLLFLSMVFLRLVRALSLYSAVMDKLRTRSASNTIIGKRVGQV